VRVHASVRGRPAEARRGDSLEARLEVLEVRPSRSKPDRGIVRLRCVMANQQDEEVLSFIANVMFRRRPAAAQD
jgi:acyl dehydratase